MKKKYYWTCAFFLGLLFACNEEDDVLPKIQLVAPTAVSQVRYADDTYPNDSTDIRFVASGAWRAEVHCISPENSEISVSATWLQLSQYAGDSAGEYMLRITTRRNFSGRDRKAKIKISCGGEVVEILVEQRCCKRDGISLQRVQTIRFRDDLGPAYRSCYNTVNREGALYFSYDNDDRVVHIFDEIHGQAPVRDTVFAESYVVNYSFSPELQVKCLQRTSVRENIVDEEEVQYTFMANEQGLPEQVVESHAGYSKAYLLHYTDEKRLQDFRLSASGHHQPYAVHFDYVQNWLQAWEIQEVGDSVARRLSAPESVLYPHHYPTATLNLNPYGLYSFLTNQSYNIFALAGLLGEGSERLLEAIPTATWRPIHYPDQDYFDRYEVVPVFYPDVKQEPNPYGLQPVAYTFDEKGRLSTMTITEHYAYGVTGCEIYVGDELKVEDQPAHGYAYEIKNVKWYKVGEQQNRRTYFIEYQE